MREMSGCRLVGRQLSLILPGVVYAERWQITKGVGHG